MKINNRRYLGNKYKLLSFIKKIVNKECGEYTSFFDVFSGTGVVASAFMDKDLILNDILYSNYLAHLTWFSSEKYSIKKIERIINKYNKLSNLEEENYMTENFSDTFFSKNVCSKAGHIREDIEQLYRTNKINEREKAILITSLIYALDKIANTCGHYDAYRKGAKYTNDFTMDIPEISDNISKNNKCYNMDSNILAEKVNCDVAYLDPPYNSRQYSDAYHLLENIAKWEKPIVSGVARKMDRTSLKSDYCTTKAVDAFEDLINKLNCKYILLSYNNTGEKANGRSNAKISDEDIMRILSKKGKVKVYSQSYKAFTTGKSVNNDNKERIFLCKVNNDNRRIISSPLNYTGGKAKLLPQLLPLFPTNISSFVDIFCGGLNVGINIKANKYYYNDINECLMGLYNRLLSVTDKTFISNVDSIIKEYNLSNVAKHNYEYYGCNGSDGLCKYNKEGYLKLRNDFNSKKTSDKLYYEMFFTLIVYCFNNQIRFNKSGKFNSPVGKRDFNNNIRIKLKEFINKLHEQQPNLLNIDFSNFDINLLDKDSFVYCDPPYLITTASYNENGGWTINDEKKLLEFLDILNAKKIKFALSNVTEHKGKQNKLLIEWVKRNNYNINYLNYNYNNSNYHSKNTGKKTNEVLVTNYNVEEVK